MTVLVTGARGRIAARVIADLVEAGIPVRAASSGSDPVDVPSGVPTIRASLREPDSLATALRGADAVFVYCEPTTADAVVDQMRSAGVERVVVLSALAAGWIEQGGSPGDDGTPRPASEVDPLAWRHVVMERAVARSGLGWTFVRPGMFATNTLRWAPGIRADGTVRLARPHAEAAPVHERDVAAVAVRALTESGHDGQRYPLTGPESISQARQVELIAAAIGRPVRLVELSDEQARVELARWTTPAVADRLVANLVATDGRPTPALDTVCRVLGRPATSYADWAIDHAADFR